MIRDAEIHEAIVTCLYTSEELEGLQGEELPAGCVVVEGVIQKFGFHPGRQG